MVRVSLGIAFALVLTACAGAVEEADTAATQTSPQTETTGQVSTTQADAAPQPTTTATASPGGGATDGPNLVAAGDSTVSVDGQSLNAQQIVRCIPFSDTDGNLDLTMVGDGFTLFVYVSENTSGSVEELNINGPAVGDGLYAGTLSEVGGSWINDSLEPVDGPAFDWQGDRISGTMTLADITDTADPVDVRFDMIVPSDVSDCSL